MDKAANTSRALRGMRTVALAGIAVLILAASAASFAESFRGLYEWASRHGVNGTWAAVWPLQLDVFIATGELALLVGLTDRWQRRDRIGAWLVTGLGVAASVAANVGHVASADWTSRVTGAVPPLAAAAALAVGLGVLKRVAGSPAPDERVPQPASVPVRAKAPVLADPSAAATGSAGPVITAGHRRQRGKAKVRRQLTRLTPAQQDAAVVAALQGDPNLTKAALARAVGISDRSVGRSLERISTPVPDSA